MEVTTEVIKTKDLKAEQAAPVVKRKTLEQLFNDPSTVLLSNAQVHAAFQLTGVGTENSLNAARPGYRGLEMVYHPGYGLIGRIKGRYFLAPQHNVMVAFETIWRGGK